MKTLTKPCTKCGEVFPTTTEFFHKDKYKKSGLTPACIFCRRKQTQQWKEKFPEYCLAKANEWYRLNGTPTYISWTAMKKRCLDPNNDHYPSYGAKGVKVCDRWLGKDGFKTFLSDMGERPENTTLGRFGDLGNYEPENCKWMTFIEQQDTRWNR